MLSADTAATIDPPQGWTNDEANLARDYYWTNKANSLKDVLRIHYDLPHAEPIWTRNPEYGGVQFIFQARPNNKEKLIYHWNGLEDTVAQFEETSLQKLKEDIDAHGEGKGYLEKLKFKDLEDDSE